MPERDARRLRVKQLLAQDPDINDTHLKEFRMQLDQTLESYEQKSKRTRRAIMIALAVYLIGMIGMVACRVAWHNAAPDATAGLIRGLIYLPIMIAAIGSALIGIWLLALYLFKYAPQLNRARFEVQTSILLDLQQEMKRLHESMNRQNG